MDEENTENHIKLHLLEYKVGTSVLRELFLKIVQNSSCNGDVDKYLEFFKSKLQKLRSSRQLSHRAFQELFPDKPNERDVDKWDVTLLSIVLRYCCNNTGTLRDLLVNCVKNNFNLDTLLQNESDCGSRSAELTDEQNDQLFANGGNRREIHEMDSIILFWVVRIFGDESVLMKFNRSIWNYIRTEIELADTVDDFIDNNLKNKEKLEETVSENKLPSLRNVLEIIKGEKDGTRKKVRKSENVGKYDKNGKNETAANDENYGNDDKYGTKETDANESGEHRGFTQRGYNLDFFSRGGPKLNFRKCQLTNESLTYSLKTPYPTLDPPTNDGVVNADIDGAVTNDEKDEKAKMSKIENRPFIEWKQPVKCCKIVSEIALNIKSTLENETLESLSTISQMRNELGHNQAAIDKTEFDYKWEQLLNAINKIVHSEIPEMSTAVEKMINDITTNRKTATLLDSLEISQNIARDLLLITKAETNTVGKRDESGFESCALEKTAWCFDPSFEINVYCRENGRKSPIVKSICDFISNLLYNCSPKILRVWPAYKPAKEEDVRVVFVAVTDDDKIEDIRIPPPLDKFEIKYRTANEYSPEESIVIKYVNRKEICFNDSMLEQLGSLLRKNSKRYMDEHQNLNIMSASPLKSVKYGEEIKHETCVVFYVEMKGSIPLGEDEFPKYLDGFATDVRESSFKLFSPTEFHQSLKMGCLIASSLDQGKGISGTLGAFVDLPDGSVGCFTSAHAILHGHLMQDLIKDKLKIYDESNNTHVYQPIPGQENSKNFGHVIRAIYKEGGLGETGLEAALIKITDPSRLPDSAEFPIQDCESGGLAHTSRFKSGKILTNIPKRSKCLTMYKFGAETCLTRGAFQLHGSSVRTSTLIAQEMDFGVCLHNQIEMTTVGPLKKVFAKAGDSGAAVLIPHNGDENDLRAIGIITGGNEEGTIFVTPIVDILRAFGYDNIGSLKSFQYSPDAGQNVGPMDTEDFAASSSHGNLYQHDISRNVSVESFEEFKVDVNTKFQKIDDGQSNLEGGQKETKETLKSMHEMLTKLVTKETKGE